ncbi:hypothetical protein HYV49_00360 [Candidatus Pacearchaeota archaeon]|nr:hypothetical protein [Candidatus Pacearchaeota archaeon]
MKTIDMQLMRYLNLFEKITHIRTKYCFFYNNTVVFLVEEKLVSRAIGENGRHVRRIAEILGRKIKIVPFPNGDKDILRFIATIVEPIRFNGLEVTENDVIISAGRQSKAALIGRNKTRLAEIQKIIKEYFNKELKIV